MATHRVIQSFTGQGKQMLTVKSGELVTVTSTTNDDRWSTVKKDSSIGLVPSSYLEPLLLDDCPVKGARYIVLYDYPGNAVHQLPIKCGDKLVFMESHTKDWWTMKNTVTGKTGMVPTSYIKEDIQEDQEAKAEVLLSIDRAIEKIHSDAANGGGKYTAQQRSTLEALVAHRQSVAKGENETRVAKEQSPVAKEQSPVAKEQSPVTMETSPRRKAPPPPSQTVEPLDLAGVQLRERSNQFTGARPQSEIVIKRPAPPPPARTVSLRPSPDSTAVVKSEEENREGSLEADDTSSQSSNEGLPGGAISPNTKKRLASYLSRVEQTSNQQHLETVKESVQLPTEFTSETALEMIDVIRNKSGSNHLKSALALEGILRYMGQHIPEISAVMDGLLSALHSSQATEQENEKGEESEDLKRLKEILFEMREARDDSQQRGWAVRDDSDIISQYLEELLQILYDADPSVSRTALQEDKYENILVLISYYQLEHRIPLRILLLKIFGACCTLDIEIVSIMLQSVLPNELGHDMQVNTKDIHKTVMSSIVCTMIFSTSEEVPLSVYDQWNLDFVNFLLELIEEPLDADIEEELPDLFLNVLLSFNQHFEYPATNTLMLALKQFNNPRIFSEKLMLLVNREEDPVCIHKSCCPDSLTKILLDMFSDTDTANVFYTTDLKVLIDIVSRQLHDLCPGDKTRSHYIELLSRLVSSTSYTDHYHRRADISSCLKRILEEEGEESQPDQESVKLLYSKHPGIFNEQ